MFTSVHTLNVSFAVIIGSVSSIFNTWMMKIFRCKISNNKNLPKKYSKKSHWIKKFVWSLDLIKWNLQEVAGPQLSSWP